MKILGFVLIIVSCSVCGLYYADRKSERMKELASLCTMLELMQGELESRLSPFPEMMNRIGKRLDGNGSALMFCESMKEGLSCLGEKDFVTLWTECSFENLCFLQDTERRAFTDLASVLGKYDVNRQSHAIGECLNVIRNALARENQDYPEIRKLSLGLSASAGALLSIMLV